MVRDRTCRAGSISTNRVGPPERAEKAGGERPRIERENASEAELDASKPAGGPIRIGAAPGLSAERGGLEPQSRERPSISRF